MEEHLKDKEKSGAARRARRYRVLVRETFACCVDVCAESRDAAGEIVEKQIEECEVVVPRDYDEFDREISVKEVS